MHSILEKCRLFHTKIILSLSIMWFCFNFNKENEGGQLEKVKLTEMVTLWCKTTFHHLVILVIYLIGNWHLSIHSFRSLEPKVKLFQMNLLLIKMCQNFSTRKTCFGSIICCSNWVSPSPGNILRANLTFWWTRIFHWQGVTREKLADPTTILPVSERRQI